jgi:hypothetical protein
MRTATVRTTTLTEPNMDNASTHNSVHAARPARAERMEAHLRKLAHKKRCSALPAMRPREDEQLIAAFIMAHGVTRCPTVYAAAVR